MRNGSPVVSLPMKLKMYSNRGLMVFTKTITSEDNYLFPYLSLQIWLNDFLGNSISPLFFFQSFKNLFTTRFFILLLPVFISLRCSIACFQTFQAIRSAKLLSPSSTDS